MRVDYLIGKIIEKINTATIELAHNSLEEIEDLFPSE